MELTDQDGYISQIFYYLWSKDPILEAGLFYAILCFLKLLRY